MMNQGRIVKVSGPLVIAENMRDCNMLDVVHVSDKKLIGEILEIHEDRASIQVYEKPPVLVGEIVVSTGALSVELGRACEISSMVFKDPGCHENSDRK